MSIPNWAITVDHGLVKDESVYYFVDPKFIGKSYLIEDTTMYMKDGRRKGKRVDFLLDPELSDIEKKMLESEGYDIDWELRRQRGEVEDQFSQIEFDAYEKLGFSVGNTPSLARVDFA